MSKLITNITQLPFVIDLPAGSSKKRCFWHIEEGIDKENGEIGVEYAKVLISYIKKENFLPVLGLCIADMPRGKEFTQIEIGFLHYITRYLL